MGGDGALKRFAVRVGIYAGVFLAGAVGAFAYSYVPLHNAKNWRIGYLEERLEQAGRAQEALEAELAGLRSGDSSAEDADRIAGLESKLADRNERVGELEEKAAREARRAKELEKKLAAAERKARDAAGAREELERVRAELARVRAPSEPAPVAAPSPAGPGGGAAGASAAASTTVDDELDIVRGGSWVSDDGNARFDLVGIDAGVAQVVLDPTELAPGEKADAIRVRAGGTFRVGNGARAPEVLVKRVNGRASITVVVTQ